MQPKLIISFEHLSEPAFALQVEAIAPALDGNVHFPLPWPTNVAAPSAIVSAVAAYKIAYQDAAGGDKAKIKVRAAQRKALTKQLKKVAAYLEIVADGSVDQLATTGFEMRRDIVKSTAPVVLSALTDLKVKRAALSGGLIVHARADAQADVYNVQVASADPSVEANWTDVGDFPHCNRIQLTGLTPKTTYYVRIRGFNKNGHGVWATSAGILVL